MQGKKLLNVGDIRKFGSYGIVGVVLDYDAPTKSYWVFGVDGSPYYVPYDISPVSSVKLSSDLRKKLSLLATSRWRLLECEREVEELKERVNKLTNGIRADYMAIKGCDKNG